MGDQAIPQPDERSIDVTIEKMVYGGEGLARTAEGVLLVPLVIPGERVSIQLEERHKGVRRGRLIEVLEPSPDRIAADCPYFTRCGGCHYQHIRYEWQLQLKQEILRETFERIGKIHLDLSISVVASEPYHYRNRSRFRIHKESSQFEIGYFELLSHRLCPIEICPISSPGINDALGKLAHGVGAACFPDGNAEFELFASDSEQTLIATIYSGQAPPVGFAEALQRELPSLESVSWRQHRPGDQPATIKTWGSGSITYHVGEFHYRVGHGSFFQTNRFVLDAFIRAVVDGLDGKRALDLYAGVGFFTIPLAHRFEKVTAVEGDPASASDLKSNVGVVGTGARYHHESAEKFLASASKGWDVIVADPPRSGLSRIASEHICRLQPRHFVYVSCDPTTQARDLSLFIRAGYCIRSVHLVDVFPQTFHLESVVHMEHAG